MQSGYPVLNVTSTWTNTTDESLTLRPEDDLRIDGRNEAMHRSSAGVDSLFHVHDIHWQPACGIRAEGFDLGIDDNGRETFLSYEPQNRKPIVIESGANWSLTREIIVARDLPEVLAVLDDMSGTTKVYPVSIWLADSSGAPITGARLTFHSGAESRGTAIVAADGTVGVRLPEHEWNITAESAGIELPESENIWLNVESRGNRFEIASALDLGTVSVRITDARGRSIPAKVEFIGNDPADTPNWGPRPVSTSFKTSTTPKTVKSMCG